MAFSHPTSPSSFPKEVWTAALDQLSQRIREYFVRPEISSTSACLCTGIDESGGTKKWMASG